MNICKDDVRRRVVDGLGIQSIIYYIDDDFVFTTDCFIYDKRGIYIGMYNKESKIITAYTFPYTSNKYNLNRFLDEE